MKKFTLIKIISVAILLSTLGGTVLSVQAAPRAQSNGPIVISSEVEEFSSYFSVETLNFSDGAVIEKGIINGPSTPPADVAAEFAASIQPLPAEGILGGFPAYSWTLGTSAVAAGMIAGYYDRHGFPNMYTGPTDYGVMPLSDTAWSIWWEGGFPNNPLVASHKGVDGRTIKGTIDDYWNSVNYLLVDPYIIGEWPQHTWGTAIGDYMKTSQSAYGNLDGATNFHFTVNNNGKLTCSELAAYDLHSNDGTFGRKLFYEARGYTVTDCYTQVTDNFMAVRGYSGGFTLEDYKAQIDAGNPVLLNMMGVTMAGYGYGPDDMIYVHTTWDNDPYTHYAFTWGSSFLDFGLFSVSIVNFENPSPRPTPVLPSSVTNTHYPQYVWQTIPGASTYELEVYAGTHLMFSSKQGTSVCGMDYCTYTPLRFLPDHGYTWRVRARVAGVWQNWSSFLWFNVGTNFTSPFTSDAKGWQTVFGPWELFKDNFYRSPGWKGNFNSIVHDGLYADFTFTVRMMRVGEGPLSNGLIIRGTPDPLDSENIWDSGYMFVYANTGEFSIFKIVHGEYDMMKDWGPSIAIIPNGWNVLKVEANKSDLKFYINNTLVWSGVDSSLRFGRVGIGMYKPDPANPLWQPLLVDIALLNTAIP